jgi:hypothetical protein
MFQNFSLVVTRTTLDPSIPATLGMALPVWLDEVSHVDAGVRIRSVLLPFTRSAATGSQACMLSFGNQSSWLYDAEGAPSLTSDGKAIVLPCYDAVAPA